MEKISKYAFLGKNEYVYKKYNLKPLRKKDIQLIRKWRNEQIDVLRQKKNISINEQKKYYNYLEKKSFYVKKPESILFSIILDKKCIGYGGFVHIDWESQRAEISIVTMTSRNKNLNTYKKDFLAFFHIIQDLGFNELRFNRLTTETYDIRPYVMDLLKKTGFKLEGRMIKHVKIQNQYVDSLIHGLLKEDYVK